MRYLGIDYGDSKVGIAVSDPFGWTAQGVETIHWKGDEEKLFGRIKKLAEEYNIERIIVGFPRNTNGSVGERGEKTLWFIDKLTDCTGREAVTWNEWFTTASARNAMRQMNVKNSRKRELEDCIAAVFILQGYLDSIRNTGKESAE